MAIGFKIINAIAKRHAYKLAQNVNRQGDPRLFNAIMGKIDKKINLFFSNCPEMSLNPELEILQDVALNKLGIGFIDDFVDIIKYGYFGLKGSKFKLSEYLLEYRKQLNNNLPPLKGRGFIFDFRKGGVTDKEVNDMLKKIFINF